MNQYFELASQYPGLLANVGHSFAQAFASGRHAKMQEQQMALEQRRMDRQDQEQQQSLDARQSYMDAQSDASHPDVAADPEASAQAGQNVEKARNRLALYDPQGAQALTQSAHAQFQAQIQPYQIAAEKAKAQAEGINLMGKHVTDAMDAHGIDRSNPQAIWEAKGDPQKWGEIMGTARANATLEQSGLTNEDKGVALTLWPKEQIVDALKTPEGRAKLEAGILARKRAGATTINTGDNQGLAKDVISKQQTANLDATANLANSAAIREQMKHVDLAHVNSLVGGLGHRGEEALAKISPDLLSPDARAELQKVKTVKASLAQLSADRASKAKELRALGGRENSKAAELLESSIIDPEAGLGDIKAKLDAMDAADLRVKDLTARSLRTPDKGGGVEIGEHPTPVSSPAGKSSHPNVFTAGTRVKGPDGKIRSITKAGAIPPGFEVVP